MAGKLSSRKAGKILKDGEVRGKSLTSKQKKFFGFVKGGGMPTHNLGNSSRIQADPGSIADSVPMQPVPMKAIPKMPNSYTAEGGTKGSRASLPPMDSNIKHKVPNVPV